MADEATTEVKVPEEGATQTKAEPDFQSGMARRVEFMKNPSIPIHGKEEANKEPEKKEAPKSETKTYDYTFYKDLTEDDYKKHADLKTKDEGLYHQTLGYLNDMKKNQRLVSARERELQELKTQNPNERLAKLEEFIGGFKQDAIGTYKKYQKDFDLPDVDFLEKQVNSGGDISTRLEQWQESELTPKIEKKFKIEQGTFVYDPSQAYKAGTPSYEFRVETDKKEHIWASEYEASELKQREVVTKVKEQTDKDYKFLKDTFFPDAEFETPEKANEAFVGYLKKLDEIQDSIRTGEFDPEKSPFSLRNIFRGIHFDELVKTREDKLITSIHKQYNEKGLYLPSGDQPTDATKLTSIPTSPNTEDGKNKFSPMHRSVSRMTQR
jgi:hypothetical protein